MSTTSTNGHRSFTKEGTPPSIIPLNGMRMLKPYAGGGGRNPILPYSPSPRQHQHYHFAPSSPHSHSPSPSAAVAKQAAPMVAGFQNHNAEMPDLEGGTLLDVKEVSPQSAVLKIQIYKWRSRKLLLFHSIKGRGNRPRGRMQSVRHHLPYPLGRWHRGEHDHKASKVKGRLVLTYWWLFELRFSRNSSFKNFGLPKS